MINQIRNLRTSAGFVAICIVSFPFMSNAQSNAPQDTDSIQVNQHLTQTYHTSKDDNSSYDFHHESERSSRTLLLILLCGLGGMSLLVIVGVLLQAIMPESGEIRSLQPRLVSGIIINRPIELKSERMSYMLRNSAIPFLIFLFTLWRTYPFDSASVLKYAPAPMAIAFLFLIRQAWLYKTTIYELDEMDIRIKSKFIIAKVKTIKYRTVKEVRYKQAFYERKKNVGTVEIVTDYDDEGNPITTDLTSIYNHKEVALLIAEKAGIKMSEQDLQD